MPLVVGGLPGREVGRPPDLALWVGPPMAPFAGSGRKFSDPAVEVGKEVGDKFPLAKIQLHASPLHQSTVAIVTQCHVAC
jgi:hypothetical protein